MVTDVVYTLKVFSSNIDCGPIVKFEAMDVILEFKGYDDNDIYHECRIKFVSVVGYKYVLSMFDFIKGSYDTIIEILDSEWKEELIRNNKEEYDYWKPKHYALYLDDVGLYQILARDVIVEEK